MLTILLKSFDTIATIAITSSSITLSLTGFGLIGIPISSSMACGLAFSNKIKYEILIQKYNKYKKQYQKDQKTIKTLDKVYHKSLQGILFDKKEYESLCLIFTKCFYEKNECFL